MPNPPDESRGGARAALPVAQLDTTERIACLRLIRSENVGPATFRALINHYGGAAEALAALPAHARKRAHRAIRICPRDAAEQELEAAHRIGAEPLFNIEPGFPAALAVLEGAPPLLYVKGDVRLLTRPAIAMVGARDGSALGQKLARTMATAFGKAGYVVVSGLARGIDGAAHQAALETGTVAVLAGGIDNVYPPEHAALQQAIGEKGCLVSEQPPGFQPRGQDFPRRNRIISGISIGVVVVEAARRSGSLITARMAAEQGREVFAVPGHPLDPRAEGSNQLLKEGATIATTADDVLSALAPLAGGSLAEPRPVFVGVRAAAPAAVDPAGSRATPAVDGPAPLAQPAAPAPGDDIFATVLQALGPAPVEIDELARATGLEIRSVNVALIELALAGQVTFHGHQLVSVADTWKRGG